VWFNVNLPLGGYNVFDTTLATDEYQKGSKLVSIKLIDTRSSAKTNMRQRLFIYTIVTQYIDYSNIPKTIQAIVKDDNQMSGIIIYEANSVYSKKLAEEGKRYHHGNISHYCILNSINIE